MKYTEHQLMNTRLATKLYLMFLQVARLIKIFDDTMQEDPFNREGVMVRLTQCAIPRGYQHAERMVK